MLDVTPTDSDSPRDRRRIGPIAQEMLTVAFAIAAWAVVLLLMAPAPAAAATGPASAPQQLAAPTTVRDGVFVPSAISSADLQPEALPPTF